MIWLVGSEFALFLVALGAALERAHMQRVRVRRTTPVEAGEKVVLWGVANEVTT